MSKTIVFLGLIVSMLAPGLVRAQAVVDEIFIEGNSRVEESTIMLQVSSEVGKPLDPSAVEKDIKEIYRAGFFEKVSARLESSDGKTRLIFDVVEKPAIRNVTVEGNEVVSDETLREKLTIGARRFLDSRKIAAGIDGAKAYYQEKGYYGTEIDYTAKTVEGNQVDLEFVVREGEKRLVREVVFEGNNALESDDLEDVVDVTRYKWWISWATGGGVVKKEMLENDVKKLMQHYLEHGFVEVHVGEPVIENLEDGIRVVFKIEEGDVFSIGTISAIGTLLEDSEEKTIDGLKLKSGETFNVDFLRKDVFTVSDKFTDIGYAFVNVEPLTKINRETKTVDVQFNVDKGEIVSINRIDISGNKKTKDNVIRRSVEINEQEIYSSSKIRRSQELIQRLGFFEEVNITSDVSPYEDMVDLDISVREGMTGTFSVGAGISSGDGFIVSTQISENNLFGTGRSLTFDVDTGSRRRNYILSFQEPRLNDTRWSVGMEALAVEREFDDFDRKEKGGSVNFGYPLWFLGPEYLDDVRFGLGYEYLVVDIDDVEDDAPTLIRDQEGRTNVSSFTPRIVRDTINNPLDPTSGSRQSASIELAGVGGDEEFWLARLSNTIYYSLFDISESPVVFSQRTNFGYGKTFDDEDFPVFRRFFPGGINSVRGYEEKELGPEDETGSEYGGNKQFVANFELIFPFFSTIGLKGLVFYDVGEAFDDDESIKFSELRQAFGWGFRWRTPIAPIRIEIGYPIDKEEGERSVVTHFSFGAPR